MAQAPSPAKRHLGAAKLGAFGAPGGASCLRQSAGPTSAYQALQAGGEA